MHCSNKTCVDSGERSKANESHNFFFNSKKGVMRAFLCKLFGGKSDMYVVFIKKIIRRKEQQEFIYSFSCFYLEF
jgi:hypothetical protein